MRERINKCSANAQGVFVCVSLIVVSHFVEEASAATDDRRVRLAGTEWYDRQVSGRSMLRSVTSMCEVHQTQRGACNYNKSILNISQLHKKLSTEHNLARFPSMQRGYTLFVLCKGKRTCSEPMRTFPLYGSCSIHFFY